jgi:hypothetical protein
MSTKNSTGKVDTSNPQPRSPPTALLLIRYYILHSLRNAQFYEFPYICTLHNLIRQRSRPQHRLKDRFLSLPCMAVIFWISFLYTTTHPYSCKTHRVNHQPYPILYTKFDRIGMPLFFLSFFLLCQRESSLSYPPGRDTVQLNQDHRCSNQSRAFNTAPVSHGGCRART